MRPLFDLSFRLLLACLASAHAQAQSPLPEPNIALKTFGMVNAWVPQSGGGFVIGGSFSSINGVSRSNLARLHPDGSLDLDWNPRLDGVVHALALDASGAVYVGGEFTSVNGSARGYLARLSGTGDGSPDPNWNPSANARVMALAFDEISGGVFVGGWFTTIAGQSRKHIAKLTVDAVGLVDSEWNPSSEFVVEALVPDGHGAIFARGSIHLYPTYTLVRDSLTKFRSTGLGTKVPEWNPSNLGALSVAVDKSTGAVYVGGYNGSLRQLANDTGAMTAEWILPGFSGSRVTLVAVNSDNNTIYAGGRSRLTRLVNGAAPDANWSPLFSSTPRVLAFGTNHEVYAGGAFGVAGGETRLSAALIDAAGNAGPVVDVERPGYANVLEVQPSGGIIVGGSFYKADGLLRRGLLRLTPEGTVDPDWNPSPGSGSVRNVAIDQVTGHVYVSGTFAQIGGQTRQYLAKLEGGGTGAADPDWNPSPTDEVLALAVDGSGAVFVGGLFHAFSENSIGGQKRDYLAKLAGDGIGAADPDWNPDPGSLVDTLALDSAGHLFAGGQFSEIGGQACEGLAKLSIAGSGLVDPDWTPAIDGRAGGLVPDGNGNLYVHGWMMTAVNGLPRKLAKLSMLGAGVVDPDWDPAPEGYVNAIALGPDGSVYVGGVFTTIGGQPRNHLAKLSATGSGAADTRWNPSASAPGVAAVALDPVSGALYAGGTFTSVGGLPRDGFAAIAPVLFSDGFETAPQ